MENRKNKSLHNITIEKINFNTLLRYNINTNHIEISTKFNYQNPNKTKQYQEANRDPNISRMGSEEHRIKNSCRQQGIAVEDFDGFLQDKRYCKLWTEKFRQSIRDRFHNKCYLCNKTEKDNGRKLSVHHVNYNKSCLCGSNCEFVSLCSKCHTKTNFDRQIWEDLIMCYLSK